jgi:hypothetical protein
MEKTIQEERRFRRDVGFLEILCTIFQKFDHGTEIEQSVPTKWNLKIGDVLEYECGCDISGTAKVVKIYEPLELITGRTTCAFIKLS